MQIIPIPALRDNYIWCLFNPSTKCCAIVDPGVAAPVLAALQMHQLKLTAILITHHHADHSGGITELTRHYNVPVYGPANEIIAGVTHPCKEGDIINLPELDVKLKVLDIPGHTRGHIAYYGNGVLFCGDTLFTGGCGRLFEGTAEQLLHSLHKLRALPDDTQVYCGHEYTESNLKFAYVVDPNNPTLRERMATTHQIRQQNQPTVPASLCLEKQTNPFLRTQKPEITQAVEAHFGEKMADETGIFAYLRRWKDNFS